MIRPWEIKDSLLHFLFPHICSGCGNDNLSRQSMLCLRCLHALPGTGFEFQPANPVERNFWGRLPFLHAMARFYFTRGSLVQRLVHQLKYRGNRDIGLQLGRLMGESLKKAGRFEVDALVPLPLYPARERKRGYNQAAVLCSGIREVFPVPVLEKVIGRSKQTDTQTRKGRIGRWQNMEGKFVLQSPESIRHKHILLVDDVITTGATLEACGNELLKAGNVTLSFAALAYALRV